jgi:hypothetical protein
MRLLHLATPTASRYCPGRRPPLTVTVVLVNRTFHKSSIP